MMVKGLSEADGEQANKGGPKPYFALTLLVHDPPYVSTTINFFEWDCTISCSTNEYHEHQETRMIEIESFCSMLLWTCWSLGVMHYTGKNGYAKFMQPIIQYSPHHSTSLSSDAALSFLHFTSDTTISTLQHFHHIPCKISTNFTYLQIMRLGWLYLHRI